MEKDLIGWMIDNNVPEAFRVFVDNMKNSNSYGFLKELPEQGYTTVIVTYLNGRLSITETSDIMQELNKVQKRLEKTERELRTNKKELKKFETALYKAEQTIKNQKETIEELNENLKEKKEEKISENS